ncbi:hypothetical protein [Ferrovibrio sp.]|uniref:hypothetical protein n=1 Tax=Ferrovibrio sp. TaxID=1917215 RepID=UPI0025C13D03|nr:hypothetical protein [Ferrovibrio sp.]MBX3455905.1 hypothetical protein [Ferrovibrio sp.]
MAYTEIDTDSLFARMFGAAREESRDSWSSIRGLVKVELKSLARKIKEAGKAVATGDISEENARLLLRLDRVQIATVVAATSAITLPAAERAIGSSIDAVRESVNGALGFYLL